MSYWDQLLSYINFLSHGKAFTQVSLCYRYVFQDNCYCYITSQERLSSEEPPMFLFFFCEWCTVSSHNLRGLEISIMRCDPSHGVSVAAWHGCVSHSCCCNWLPKDTFKPFLHASIWERFLLHSEPAITSCYMGLRITLETHTAESTLMKDTVESPEEGESNIALRVAPYKQIPANNY